MSKWTQDEAIRLCTIIEAICPKYGYHVALTGGLLYKLGKRKDCDILFYSVRQAQDADQQKLIDHLVETVDGLEYVDTFGWLCKLKYHGKAIDAFFPEEEKSQADGKSTADPDDKPRTSDLPW